MKYHILSILLGLAVAVLCLSRDTSSQPLDDGALAVRVASYNAWLLPIGASDTAERRERIGPAINDLEPDVVCLQEVWTVHLFEPIQETLAQRLPNVGTGGGGLAILSRWPLDEVEFQAYPSETAASFLESFVPKGWLTAVADTPAGPLRIVNSHLAFDRSEDRADHAAQLAILVEALHGQTDIPTILCADLNLRGFVGGAPTEGFAQLLDIGFEDAASNGSNVRAGTRVGWPREGRTAGWDPDYVLFRHGDVETFGVAGFRQALDTTETALSDHNLQLADLLLGPR